MLLCVRQNHLGKAFKSKNLFLSLAATSVVTSMTLMPSAANAQSTALEETAANYIQFREDVAAVEATPIENAAATRFAHKQLTSYDSEKLSAGWVAYAALVAAETPEFAASLQRAVTTKKKKRKKDELDGIDAFYANLAANPTYARQLDGAQAAIDRVLNTTAQDMARIGGLGETFKSQAYAIQKTKWGKKKLQSSSARLEEASSFAATRAVPSVPYLQTTSTDGVTTPMLASTDTNWAADWGSQGSYGYMDQRNGQVIIDRVLNLAARYSLGGINSTIVDVYAKNNKSERCLSMSKLTLSQCIAATRTPYEEAFCLGEHGLNDITSCVGWISGFQ